MDREVGVAQPTVKFTDGVSTMDQSCRARPEKVKPSVARRLRKNCKRGPVRPGSLHSQGLGYEEGTREVRQPPQPRPGIHGGCFKQCCMNPLGDRGFCNVTGLNRMLSSS